MSQGQGGGRPKIELSDEQKDFICYLAACEGMTMCDIAKKMGMSEPTIWEHVWKDDRFFHDFMRATDSRSVKWYEEVRKEITDKSQDCSIDKDGCKKDHAAVVNRSKLIADNAWRDYQQAHFALASTRAAVKGAVKKGEYDVEAHLQSVIDALKDGSLNPKYANEILGVVEKACKIKETIDILPRLKALEAAANLNNT